MQDRRIHKIFVTRNTEYHLRKNFCVGVRDRRSLQWVHEHKALRTQMIGGLRFHRNGQMGVGKKVPCVGESLCFDVPGMDLVTSPIVSVERADKEVVLTYNV